MCGIEDEEAPLDTDDEIMLFTGTELGEGGIEITLSVLIIGRTDGEEEWETGKIRQGWG